MVLAPEETHAPCDAERGGDPTHGPVVDWSELVPKLVHPTKVIILEAMSRIGRPMSASELEKVADGSTALNSFSYHLDRLFKVGALAVVGKVKARRSSSAKKETFFFFFGQDQWISDVTLLGDSTDPLVKLVLSQAESKSAGLK